MMKQAPVVACFGRRGVGKTTLARTIARHQSRLVVWDYLGEYGPLAFRTSDPDSLAEYLSWARGRRFAAARFIPDKGTVEEFEAFCAAVYQSGNLLVVVEEAAAVCQASYLPPAFGRIVRQGRHRGLGLLWCSQRLNEVSRTLTSLTDVWAGFSLSEPGDLQALALRCGREYADKVAALPRFQWVGFDVDSQAMFTGTERLKTLWGAPAGAWPETVKEENSHLKARHVREPVTAVTRNRKFRLFPYLR
ncbi:MAG TPA: hypothetical protein VNJ12_06000 [Candidatus Dormibacteraeota bacterium]|nr:hypothetical protein [Candidatus Dormibacteraeota bacterium]